MAIEAARKKQGQERVLRRQLRWGWEPWPELCRGVVKMGNDVQTALRQTLRPSGWPFRFKIFRSVLLWGEEPPIQVFGCHPPSSGCHPARPSGDASSPRIFPVSHISFPLPLPALSRPPSCEARDGGVWDTLLQGSFRAMSEQLSRTCRQRGGTEEVGSREGSEAPIEAGVGAMA